MLSTKPLKAGSAKGIVAYCRHAKPTPGAKGGYYSERGAPSFWAGRLAAESGLAGAVEAQDFLDALEGRIGGQDIGKGRSDRRHGHDVTLSAPKSVSMLALIGGDQRVLEAHDAAVKKAIEYVEKEVATSRHGKNGTKTKNGGGLACAVFRHEDSRSVSGVADPQLHSHCIILNATRGQDGQLRSTDLDWGERAVRMHLADSVYKSCLARSLIMMGYAIGPTEDGFEIADIQPTAIEHFSQRRVAIDEALKEAGLARADSTATQRTAANLRTRQAKSCLSQLDQRQEWHERALDLGLTLPGLARRAIRTGIRPALPSTAGAAVRSAARHLSERASIFSRDLVRLDALKSGIGTASLDEIDHAIALGEAGLVDAGAGKMVTEHSIYMEQSILMAVRAGNDQIEPIVAADEATRFIAAREVGQGWQYGAGQRAAIRLALTSQDRHVGIVGAAGAGKTTAMSAIVASARAAGLEIIGLAPSTSAARELKSAGIETTTIAAFLTKPPPGGGRLILIDEAGMIGSNDMERLLHQIESAGDRAIFVGDPRQLASVAAGSPYQQMIESGSLATARISEIQRQKSPELLAIATAFAAGRAAQAVNLARPYMQEVHIETDQVGKDGRPQPTTAERRAAIATATAQAYLNKTKDERAQTLVLSGTNVVRRQINDVIRCGLQAKGEISGNDIEIIALDKIDATKEELGKPITYREGMIVRLFEDKRLVDYTVDRVESGLVVLAGENGVEKRWKPTASGRVYHGRRMAIAAGDRVVFREPSGRGAERITNGAGGAIEGVDLVKGVATVRLDDGRVTTIDSRRGVAIDRGWCLTVHLSQGRTVDSVIVAGEASRTATAESAYVACSRERHSLSIITDSITRLAKSWSGWAERKTALSAIGGAGEVDRERLGELRAAAAAKLAEPAGVVERERHRTGLR